MGAVFDGNIESLGGAFGFDGRVNRTVVASTAAITEALRTSMVSRLSYRNSVIPEVWRSSAGRWAWHYRIVSLLSPNQALGKGSLSCYKISDHQAAG